MIDSVEQLFEQALSLHAQGNLYHAQCLYERILSINTNHTDALHNLAVLYMQKQNMKQACLLLDRAYTLCPQHAQYRFTYIEALLASQQAMRAWTLFHDTLNQGMTHPAQQRLRVKICQALPGPTPQEIARLEKFFLAKKYDAMISLVRQILKKYPYHTQSKVWLGMGLFEVSRPTEALSILEQVVVEEPHNVDAWSMLGLTYNKLKMFEKAHDAFQQSVSLFDKNEKVLLNAARNAFECEKLDEALLFIEKALAICSYSADIWHIAASIFHKKNQWEKAEAAYRQAIHFDPHRADYLSNLATLLKFLNRDEEAIACYRHAIKISSGRIKNVYYTNLLFALCHLENVSIAFLADEHKAFGQRLSKLCNQKNIHKNGQQPDRPLRIGFVSADLYNHSVAYFLDPIWNRIDTTQYMLYVYSMVIREDKVTQFFKKRAMVWRDVCHLSDDALEKQIRSDKIDILIDLSGHTQGNRLPVFARKPAPIQMSWLGYPFTTGLSTIDYYIGEATFLPEGKIDPYFAEKIIRLPSLGSFAIPVGSPDVSPLPALKNGYITFGSFNRSSKLTESCIELWSRILSVIPSSQLLIGAVSSLELQTTIINRFAQYGILVDRLLFEKHVIFEKYLELHAKVDIILDTLPYTGGTTTNYALMMGVPVLTLAGDLPAQRQGVALLASVGLTDWVAHTKEEYVHLAQEKATQIEQLAKLRAELRNRAVYGELRQNRRITYSLELAWRKAWQRWCAGLPPEAFHIDKKEIDMIVTNKQNKSPMIKIGEGWALFTAGKYDELEKWTKLLLEQYPHTGKLWHLLGLSFLQRQRNEEAYTALKNAVAFIFNDAELWDHLGVANNRIGQKEQAAICYEKSLVLNPNRVATLNNAAKNANEQGLFVDGERYARKAVSLEPTFIAALNNLGWALNGLCRPQEAIDVLKKVIPEQDSKLLSTLASANFALGNVSTALEYYTQALQCDSNCIEIYNNLANTLMMFNRYGEAIECYLKALALNPRFYDAMLNLAGALQWIGRNDEALSWLQKVLEAQPENMTAYANKLFSLSHLENISPEQLAEAHFGYGKKLGQKYHSSRYHHHSHSRQVGRRLKIGFISGDMRSHPVAHFVLPLFSVWNHTEFELCIYYNHVIEDEMTMRIKSLTDQWSIIVGQTPTAVAEKIWQDQIDILVDLSGHTAFNCLEAFALKPAPIQVSCIGYPGTTGLQEMDYYFVDTHFAPPGMLDSQFTEKLVYLTAVATFEPVENSPVVNTLPALKKGYITFGSFNRSSKISLFTIRLWSQVLKAVPGSELALGGMGEPQLEQYLIQNFAQNGIQQDRLRFLPRQTLEGYLAQHYEIDLLLDTFPYTGGTTTYHALWMGVPALTLAGQTLPARQGVAIMNQIGLLSFVASNEQAYIESAQYWASHLDELAILRTTLRQRILSTELRNPQVVYDSMSAAFRHMWHLWCDGKQPQSFISK